MRIISLNVNGIRSAERLGFARWLTRAEPWDVVCLQEVRANAEDIPKALHSPRRCTSSFYAAQRKGYAGVGMYVKHPATFTTGFGTCEFDAEGRYLQADFANASVVSVYLPSGSAGPHRQESKYRFLAAFLPHLRKLVATGREVVLCGDWNIAHQPIDLKNWRSNQKLGVFAEERAWLSQLLDDIGLVDVFRKVDPRPDQYTFWSNRGDAYAKNVGWRIDYQLATKGIAATAHTVSIYKNGAFPITRRLSSTMTLRCIKGG